MRKDDCIFCRIVEGDIPSRTIYEDELFRVILDVSPATKGHALILPKNHYDNLFSLGDRETEAIFPLAKKMATAMTKALGCQGFNLLQNNGIVAGQTVYHFHMHLIPRYEEDGNQEKLQWNHQSFTDEELDELCKLLSL